MGHGLTGLEIGLNFHLSCRELAKKLTSPSQKYHLSFLIIVKQSRPEGQAP